MHSLEIKRKYIDFFKSKDHTEVPNVSLIPENDPTSLFNIAGMQPLTPYFPGTPHPMGKRLVNVQRCVRTIDIEEVGDTTHNTFFEMIGYWSLGSYFKEKAIEMTFEFYTSKKYMNLDPRRIYVTVFKGDKDAPLDQEAIEIWEKQFTTKGIKAEVYDKDSQNNDQARVFPLAKKENWWGPVGETGPSGPCSEVFYWRGKGEPDFKEFVPWDDSNMFIELGNDVFMAYDKTKDGGYKPLKQINIDFGGGFERIALVMQLREEDGSIPMNKTIFNTDLFDTPLAYIRSQIEDESRKSTKEENRIDITEFDPTLTDIKDYEKAVRSIRIILDHLRASTFLVADGIEPSNKDQGYILRRLLRRAIRHAKLIGIERNFTKDLAELYIEKYKPQYPHLETNSQKIIDVLEKEEINFEHTIQRGFREVEKLTAKGEKITGKDLFFIFETYGYPIEMALDSLQITDYGLRNKYITEFNKAKESHQKKSRKGAGKFSGGLADHTEISKRYHTATHLLLKALQTVLGDHVHQRGSNITEERLRFDFSHPKMLSTQELEDIKKTVNDQIDAGLKIEKKEMSKDEALKIDAECEFPERYPDTVSVYILKNPKTGKIFSKELCGGPHVENTKELAESGKFRIVKEESSSSGVRRIRAVLTKK
ncbi:alanine--tRNA ligase [Patescibacteria group bacterium]|nr:alanine--tRNA ligase [Patescibacteria group bacterium]